jgi:hypothetical protein
VPVPLEDVLAEFNDDRWEQDHASGGSRSGFEQLSDGRLHLRPPALVELSKTRFEFVMFIVVHGADALEALVEVVDEELRYPRVAYEDGRAQRRSFAERTEPAETDMHALLVEHLIRKRPQLPLADQESAESQTCRALSRQSSAELQPNRTRGRVVDRKVGDNCELTAVLGISD